MLHMFNIAIDFDDERIVKSIEGKAESEVIKMICSKVEEIIYQKSYWGTNNKDLSPLRNMVNKKVDELLKENKDFILAEAAKILADRLLRTKAGKALVAQNDE